MREYGNRTRNLVRFPDDELLDRMRGAARNQLREHLEFRGKDFPVEGIDTGAAIYPDVYPPGGGPVVEEEGEAS